MRSIVKLPIYTHHFTICIGTTETKAYCQFTYMVPNPTMIFSSHFTSNFKIGSPFGIGHSQAISPGDTKLIRKGLNHEKFDLGRQMNIFASL